MLDIIKITVPVLTSLAVCYITLYFTNKSNEKEMEIQQKNHIESMKLSEKKHQEQLLVNEENERLKHLPYLSLVPKYKIHKLEGEMKREDKIISIPFKLINEGVGAAFSVQFKLVGDNELSSTAIAFQDNYNNGYDVLGVREPIEKDVLRVENVTESYLYLTAINENLNEVSPTNSIKWEFEIIFYDIQERKYSQTYSFYSSTIENKIYRVNSYMPHLIE